MAAKLGRDAGKVFYPGLRVGGDLGERRVLPGQVCSMFPVYNGDISGNGVEWYSYATETLILLRETSIATISGSGLGGYTRLGM